MRTGRTASIAGAADGRPAAALRAAAAVCALALALPAGLHAQQAGTVEVNGVVLPYEVRGSGTPLVLIHGWAVNRAFWDGDVEALAREHTVIRYDRRGYGEATGKPDLTADAADLAGLLERLGYEKVHVMGHSQGAAVALTFAVRYPEKVEKLILFGGVAPAGLAPPPDPAEAPQFGAWAQAGKTYGVDSLRAAIGRWAGANFGGVTPEMGARAMRLLETYDGEDLLDPAPPASLAPPAEAGDLGRIAVPTLILVGELDMQFIRLSADALAGALPDARKVVIAGGGHVANWNHPERFAAEVLAFLR